MGYREDKMNKETPRARTATVRRVPIDSLHEDPANARAHPERNREAVRASLREFGQVEALVVQQGTGLVIGGNCRLVELRALGVEDVLVSEVDLDDVKAKRLGLILNRSAETAEWDEENLTALLRDLEGDDLLEGLGWDEGELAKLLDDPAAGGDDPGPPPVQPEAVSVLGEVYELGPHRLVCGDSTDPAVVAMLLAGSEPAVLLHADPPYGMGKESDGVLNDNLYREKLDAFQMEWWRMWRPHLADNASAYIWGIAEDLWRLWFLGGLSQSEQLIQVRNELVWDKGTAIGMRSEQEHSYPPGSERALFIMLGQQFLGNQNKDDYFEGYEPLRSWMERQRDQAGWKNSDINVITGTQMAGHWFSKSQFHVISRSHYETIREAAAGAAFAPSYDELFDEVFPSVRSGGNRHRRDLSAELRSQRSTTLTTLCATCGPSGA
mgnify:CR=1 FL=1